MDGDGLAVEVELQSQKPGNRPQLKLELWTKVLTRRVKKLLLYIFVHPGFYMDRLVRHHEALAEVGLGPGANLARGVLDFTDDEASGVPTSRGMNLKSDHREQKTRSSHSAATSLLLNLLIGVALVQGQVGFDLKVHTARLEHNRAR